MKHTPLLLAPVAVALLFVHACSSDSIGKDPASAGSSTAGTPGASAAQGGASPGQAGSSAGTSSLAGQGGQGGDSGQGAEAGQSGQQGGAGSSQAGAADAGAAGKEASSGQAGSEPAGQGGAAGAGAGGAQAKECPTQATPMVRLTSPAGVAYCIDRVETTQAQYAAFLEAKKGDMSGQDAFCTSNLTYEPLVQKSPDDYFACPLGRWDPKGKPDYPIECVDVCDARAYCASVGKRLCGKIGGGAQNFATEEMNDPEKSQWYNACSQGGKYPYAYGPTLDESKCAEYGPAEGKPGCHAQDAPFSQILNLTGNLAELEDSQIGSSAPGGAAVSRATKGGDPEHSYRCDEFGAPGIGIGVTFRCCADL